MPVKSNSLYRQRRRQGSIDPASIPELQELIARVKQAPSDCILRLPQMKAKTGHAGSTIWKYVKDGLLPPPIRVGPRHVGWIESEIDAIIAAQVFASRLDEVIDIKSFVALLISANSPIRRNYVRNPVVLDEPNADWESNDSTPSDELVKANQRRLVRLNKTTTGRQAAKPLSGRTKTIEVTLTSRVVKKRGPTVTLSPVLLAKTGRK